jgi:hypothetical protein
VDLVPDPQLLRKSGRAGNQTRPGILTTRPQRQSFLSKNTKYLYSVRTSMETLLLYYTYYSNNSRIVLTRLSGPRSRLPRKSGSAGNRTRAS